MRDFSTMSGITQHIKNNNVYKVPTGNRVREGASPSQWDTPGGPPSFLTPKIWAAGVLFAIFALDVAVFCLFMALDAVIL